MTPVVSLDPKEHFTYLQKCRRTHGSDGRHISRTNLLRKIWVNSQVKVIWHIVGSTGFCMSFIWKELQRSKFYVYERIRNMFLVHFDLIKISNQLQITFKTIRRHLLSSEVSPTDLDIIYEEISTYFKFGYSDRNSCKCLQKFRDVL